MILDGLVVRKVNANRFLSAKCHAACDNLIKLISSPEKQQLSSKPSLSTPNYNHPRNTSIKYRHPHAALLLNMAIFSEHLLLRLSNNEIRHPNLTKFLLHLERTDGLNKQEVQLLLRGLLLCSTELVPQRLWLRIWSIMMSVVKRNVTVSIDMIYFALYLLANEVNGEKQLALMQGLAEFALVKVG